MDQNMSLNEKAVLLNKLRCQKWSGTQKAEGDTMYNIAKDYKNKNAYLLDMLMWALYGLDARSYSDWMPLIGKIFNPVRCEEAVDQKIEWMQKEDDQ